MRRFDQFITHKVLDFKFTGQDGAVLDHVLDRGQEVAGYPLKQVCAQLPLALVERLESTLGMLSMSKRQFVEMAVIDALDRVDAICQDQNAFEFLGDDAQKRDAA